MKTNKSFLKIIIVVGGILALPLAWIFIFSLGNITVTAASRQEFAHAAEKKLKIVGLVQELMVLIPDTAEQLKLEVNRSRIREMSVTFVVKTDTVQDYLEQLKKKLPNDTFEATETAEYKMLCFRCVKPDLWRPLPEITVRFSQIDIKEQGGKIEIQTF